jgi:hypothetical protein
VSSSDKKGVFVLVVRKRGYLNEYYTSFYGSAHQG